MRSDAMVSVAICIATFKRPVGLRNLLESLRKLEFKKASPPKLQIVVVDNDPASNAASSVCQVAAGSGLNLVYVPEPQTGISFARNTAVQTALEFGLDWIAFIDDDEVAECNWLDELLYVQRQYDVQAVTGPVLPAYENDIPEWIVRGGFFERPRFKTGTIQVSARTGNLLISSSILRKFSGLFDPAFAISGGEDTLASAQLIKKEKVKFMWADEAIVKEKVPLERANLKYILMRSYVGGSNWARIECLLEADKYTKLIRTVKGVGNMVLGTLLLFPAVLRGRHAIAKSASRVWLGAGSLAGVFDYSAKQYGGN